MGTIAIVDASYAVRLSNEALRNKYDSYEELNTLKTLTMEEIRGAASRGEYQISLTTSLSGDIYKHGYEDWLMALGYAIRSEDRGYYKDSGNPRTEIIIRWDLEKGENIWD